MENNVKKEEVLEFIMKESKRITEVMNALVDLGKENGIHVRFESVPTRITIPELSEVVAHKLHADPECALALIATAFEMIEELGLTVITEDEDDE